jgi:hypothetical protein
MAYGTDVTGVTLDGQPVAFKRTPSGIELKLTAGASNHLEISHTGGINVLPLVHHPAPGDSCTGMKIISDEWNGKQYKVNVEGLSGKPGKIRLIKSGKVIEHEFALPQTREKYARMVLIF